MRHRRIIGFGLAVVATIAVAGALWVDRGTASAVDDVGGEPTAEVLWHQTLEALDCARDLGARVVGPVPSLDGAHVDYSVQVTDASATIDAQCLAPVEPIARAFALQFGVSGESAVGEGPDAPALGELRGEAQDLRAIRDRIVECLEFDGFGVGAPGAAQDAALTEIAHDEPVRFAACLPG